MRRSGGQRHSTPSTCGQASVQNSVARSAVLRRDATDESSAVRAGTELRGWVTIASGGAPVRDGHLGREIAEERPT
jgi:hypothetical protein